MRTYFVFNYFDICYTQLVGTDILEQKRTPHRKSNNVIWKHSGPNSLTIQRYYNQNLSMIFRLSDILMKFVEKHELYQYKMQLLLRETALELHIFKNYIDTFSKIQQRGGYPL